MNVWLESSAPVVFTTSWQDASAGHFVSDALFMTDTNKRVSDVLCSHGVDGKEFTVSPYPDPHRPCLAMDMNLWFYRTRTIRHPDYNITPTQTPGSDSNKFEQHRIECEIRRGAHMAPLGDTRTVFGALRNMGLRIGLLSADDRLNCEMFLKQEQVNDSDEKMACSCVAK